MDAVFGGAYKWLLGPTGLGFFYASPRLRNHIDVLYVGADCVVDAEDYLHYDLALLPDARRFEYGILNKAGIIGFGASLSLFEEIGIPNVRKRVKEITDRLIQGLLEKGFTIHSPREDESWSGIVSVSKEGKEPTELLKRLYGNRVIAAVRGGRLRLAPHFHNAEEHIDRVVALLGS